MKTFLTIFFSFHFVITYGQNIYIRNNKESLDSFITRNFPETENNIVHDIIEGKWGDTLESSKIIVFYKIYTPGKSSTKAFILQLISKNKYKRIDIDHSFGIGVYPETSGIASVFFYDIDDNGIKELVVVETGAIRCSFEVEEYNNETKKNETLSTSAICDNCGFQIFEQKVNSEAIYSIEGEENYEWQCDAKTIKEILQNRKVKKQ